MADAPLWHPHEVKAALPGAAGFREAGREAMAQWRQEQEAREARIAAGAPLAQGKVVPAARAGAIFQDSISNGKFQGMICPATPMGSGRRLGNAYSSLSAQPA